MHLKGVKAEVFRTHTAGTGRAESDHGRRSLRASDQGLSFSSVSWGKWPNVPGPQLLSPEKGGDGTRAPELSQELMRKQVELFTGSVKPKLMGAR